MMARQIENIDGMFPIERIKPRDITPAEWQAAADRANEQLDLIKTLAAIELDAKTRSRSPNDTIRNYAEAVLAYIRAIRQFIETGGDVGTVLAHAISLGRLDERMGQIERFEPKVIHATKADKGLDTARKKKAGKTADRRKEITAEVKARMAANKKDSLHSARRHVADQRVISFDAVKDATANMKPRKKMKK